MRALALGAALLVLAGCTVIRRPMGEGEEPRRGARVVLLLCIFASCHHIAAPPERDEYDVVE